MQNTLGLVLFINAAHPEVGRVQVMMEFVCCVVVQKPWCFEHRLALTPVRVPSAGQAQGSIVWWFKALVLMGPAGGPKPEGSQILGVPRPVIPSTGVPRPGFQAWGFQGQGFQAQGPRPRRVPSPGESQAWGVPTQGGRGGVPSLGIPRPGVTSLKSNIRLPTS